MRKAYVMLFSKLLNAFFGLRGQKECRCGNYEEEHHRQNNEKHGNLPRETGPGVRKFLY
jgi:hypothetical protein